MGRYRATEKQVEMVKRFLPEFDTSGLTKFEAGQILTKCFYDEIKEIQYDVCTNK